jgi:hypothetical protein
MFWFYEGKGSKVCEKRKPSDDVFILERHDFYYTNKGKGLY